MKEWPQQLDVVAEQADRLGTAAQAEFECLVALCGGFRGIHDKNAFREVGKAYEYLQKRNRTVWGDLAPVLVSFGTRDGLEQVVDSLRFFDSDRKAIINWDRALVELESRDKESMTVVLTDPAEAWGRRVYEALVAFAGTADLPSLAEPTDDRLHKDAQAWYRTIEDLLPEELE